MNIKIISYSHTGNNEIIASTIAEEISAIHIQINETKTRNMVTIIMDTILNRNPKIKNKDFGNLKNDFVIFIAPIWLGQIASPMRSVFHKLKNKKIKYGFISLSGGADGPSTNNKIPEELEKRFGYKPQFIVDLHKADLLPAEPKPTRDMTMNYQITKKDVDCLVDTIKTVLRDQSLLAGSII